MSSFTEFMADRRSVDRWFVVKVAITGAFFGSLLTASYMLVALG